MTARVLVHADGGACHGTPIVDGRCPKCGIAPDTQSVELWPAPAAASDQKPGDAFYAFADALPSPPTMLLVTPAERRPCAGWVELPGRVSLLAGGLLANAYDARPGRDVRGWSIEVNRPGTACDGAEVRGGYAPTLDAAQLAAEDALLAVADEIRRAVGAVRGGKNPRESLAAIMATHPRDWSLDRGDAWIYGIVCGWDEDGEESAMDEVAARHGWSAATVDRLRRLHAEFASPTPPAAPRR